jgi:hypothetical protein
MLSFLLGLLPSALTTISGITNAISNEKIAALNATTQQEQVAATERVATLQAQRDLLIAQSNKSILPTLIAFSFAIGPMIYLNKIFIWDKVLQMGSTDPLDPHLWQVVMVILGFYFLHSFFTNKA